MKMVFKTIAVGFAIIAFGVTVAASTVFFISNSPAQTESVKETGGQPSLFTKAAYGHDGGLTRVDLKSQYML